MSILNWLLRLKYILDLKFLNFINGLRYLKDSHAKLMYDWFGVYECKSTASKYDIVCTDNSAAYRSKIWLTFHRQLNKDARAVTN